MSRLLILKKCAYISDDTQNLSYGYNSAERSRKRRVMDFLKQYYNDPVIQSEPIPYIVENVSLYDGEAHDRYHIIIDNELHPINENEIQQVLDCDCLINHLRDRKLTELNECTHVKHSGDNTIYAPRFATARLECFTGVNDLGYYRLSFKNKSTRFVIDDRNGAIYSFDGFFYNLINREDIIQAVDGESEAIKRVFNYWLNYLCLAEDVHNG